MRHRTSCIVSCLSVFLPLLPLATLAAPAQSAVLRVKAGATGAPDGQSWATAFPSIQPALDGARPGDEIWVAQGTYAGALTLSKPRVALYGGFAGTEASREQRSPVRYITFLDAEKKGRAVTITPEASEAVLDGFNIRNGYAGWYGIGGGILCHAPNVTIAHNVIQANIAASGGGLYSEAEGLTVWDNLFESNEAYFQEDTPEADGGGIYLHGGSAFVRGNTFRSNLAHTQDTMGFPQFANTTLAYGGGLYYTDTRVDIRDNVFDGNNCIARPLASRPYASGSGVFGMGGIATISNNTFVGNGIDRFISGGINDYLITGGALVLYQPVAGTVVANNILAFNASGFVQVDGSASFQHNDLFANTAGNTYLVNDPTGSDGNISADPLFADRASANLRLTPGSSAIDAGDTSVTIPGETDRDDAPRVKGLRVDMGAYEFLSSEAIILADVRTALSVSAGFTAADPSWLPRLNIVDPTTSGIDLSDTISLARKAAGL